MRRLRCAPSFETGRALRTETPAASSNEPAWAATAEQYDPADAAVRSAGLRLRLPQEAAAREVSGHVINSDLVLSKDTGRTSMDSFNQRHHGFERKILAPLSSCPDTISTNTLTFT